ncbi:hypothetical protein ACGFT2_23980 [Streptomyces sp. NPDC048514]|uniref:hypothetical protein n=1 Tax=Streptomyces sp. NPDC048514 TaxID=3365564 RepID=UPI00371A1CD4
MSAVAVAGLAPAASAADTPSAQCTGDYVWAGDYHNLLWPYTVVIKTPKSKSNDWYYNSAAIPFHAEGSSLGVSSFVLPPTPHAGVFVRCTSGPIYAY